MERFTATSYESAMKLAKTKFKNGFEVVVGNGPMRYRQYVLESVGKLVITDDAAFSTN